MRLQRGLVRLDAVSVVTGAAGNASVFGLILGFAFVAAAAGGGAVTGCVESGAGVRSAMPAAGTGGGVTSGLGARPGEGSVSPTVLSDAGGVTAGFGGAGATAGAIAA